MLSNDNKENDDTKNVGVYQLIIKWRRRIEIVSTCSITQLCYRVIKKPPSLACNDGCLDIQQTLLNDDIRGQLGMVGPNGPMRNIIESMVTGPALVILDRALEVLQDPNCLCTTVNYKMKF